MTHAQPVSESLQTLKSKVYATLQTEGFTQHHDQFHGEWTRIAPDGIREFARVAWTPDETKAWAIVKQDKVLTGNDILNGLVTLQDRYEVTA